MELACCHLCGKHLNDPADILSMDCGGDCLECMAKSGDNDCLEIFNARIQILREQCEATTSKECPTNKKCPHCEHVFVEIDTAKDLMCCPNDVCPKYIRDTPGTRYACRCNMPPQPELILTPPMPATNGTDLDCSI